MLPGHLVEKEFFINFDFTWEGKRRNIFFATQSVWVKCYRFCAHPYPGFKTVFAHGVPSCREAVQKRGSYHNISDYVARILGNILSRRRFHGRSTDYVMIKAMFLI